MHWLRAALPLLLVSCIAACSTDDDCSCNVETASQRRALACGASACIDGQRLACVNKAEIVQRGACVAPASSDDPGQMETPPADQPSSTDTGCADLQTYCSGSCRTPAATSADCQATAAAQDNDACRQWLLASGALCRP